MVPKRLIDGLNRALGFRAVLFRMVPKPGLVLNIKRTRFRAVLFRMVPKHERVDD